MKRITSGLPTIRPGLCWQSTLADPNRRALLVLEVCGELDLARANILDRPAEPGKRNDACTEKRVDCRGAWMVEEVKELCDQIQVAVFAKLNRLNHAKVHICRSCRL